MKCFIYFLTIICCLNEYVRSEVSKDFHPVLDSHFMVFKRDYSCNFVEEEHYDISSKEFIRAFSKCLVDQELITSNFTACQIDDLIVTNGEEFKCDARKISLETQLHLEDKEKELLANSTIWSIIAGENVSLENGKFESEYFGDIQETGPKYFICVLDASFENISFYNLLTFECYHQSKVMESMTELYLRGIKIGDTLEFSIFLPFMVISICCISIVLGLYLIEPMLRSTYFGKCIILFSLTFILSRSIVILTLFVDVSKEYYADSILYILLMTLQASSSYMLDLLSYEAYSAIQRLVQSS